MPSIDSIVFLSILASEQNKQTDIASATELMLCTIIDPIKSLFRSIYNIP